MSVTCRCGHRLHEDTCHCGCEWDPTFCSDCGWLDCECDSHGCDHDWLDLPESDTHICRECGLEQTGPPPTVIASAEGDPA